MLLIKHTLDSLYGSHPNALCTPHIHVVQNETSVEKGLPYGKKGMGKVHFLQDTGEALDISCLSVRELWQMCRRSLRTSVHVGTRHQERGWSLCHARRPALVRRRLNSFVPDMGSSISANAGIASAAAASKHTSTPILSDEKGWSPMERNSDSGSSDQGRASFTACCRVSPSGMSTLIIHALGTKRPWRCKRVGGAWGRKGAASELQQHLLPRRRVRPFRTDDE